MSNGSLFSKRLENAPFPYDGEFADSGRAFYDRVDAESGERLHTSMAGELLAEARHFQDDRVLFFLPPGFDPQRPFCFLLFFHGFNSTAVRSVSDFRLAEQVSASKRNAILIVPQLAVNAADSSPGKFFRPSVFRDFMAEVALILSEKYGRRHAARLETAPIILSAFSGGYKSVAYVLDRGGVSERIRGVLLLDALYDDLPIFRRWVEKKLDKSFFSLIYTDGPVKKMAKQLAALRAQKGPGLERNWPAQLAPGRIYLTASEQAHDAVPVFGPPMHPLQQMLEGLWF